MHCLFPKFSYTSISVPRFTLFENPKKVFKKRFPGNLAPETKMESKWGIAH